jgi:hypothetical protein
MRSVRAGEIDVAELFATGLVVLCRANVLQSLSFAVDFLDIEEHYSVIKDVGKRFADLGACSSREAAWLPLYPPL